MSDHYLLIPHIPLKTKNPLWSVLIPTYHCAHYLKETLASVLAQDPGEDKMEIIVIDDHSTRDDPEEVVKALGKGRVRFIRQAQNVGKVRNYETGLQASKGMYIHQLHGDDLVMPGFYQEMERILGLFPEAGAAFCRTLYIDSVGRWTGMTGMVQERERIVEDMVEKLYTEQYIQTPSMVVKREVYETIGAFDRRLDCMEDWEMWTRIANRYPIAASHQVLAGYRSHEDNATNLTFKDGSALATHQLVCKLIDEYIAPNIRTRFAKRRDQKQAEFWLLSYSNLKHQLSFRQKLQFSAKVLTKDFSLKNCYRLLS
jgi:glycosyltransferase involved in cell wall biosynthesis